MHQERVAIVACDGVELRLAEVWVQRVAVGVILREADILWRVDLQPLNILDAGLV